MSKDVRRLFAVQKAAKASSSSEVGSTSLSSRKRITHPLAKYDPTTARLTCAICGPAVPIKSDSLWNAHLVSKAHQDAVAKLRAVKEQMQKREQAAAAAAEAQQRQKQQDTSSQGGVKRKAVGGLVAYADESESESEDEEVAPSASKSPSVQDSKRIKLDDKDRQVERQIEEEEEALSGLPAGFFDSPQSKGSSDAFTGSNSSSPAPDSAEPQSEATQEDQSMEGVLPAGFFDDPEEDARVRAEVGGATTDQQQSQIDAEFKALQAELARDIEQQDEQETKLLQAQNSRTVTATGTVHEESGAGTVIEPLGHDEKVEQEEQELEETILARSEEEYQLFVEMTERLDMLREKKTHLLAQRTSSTVNPNPPTMIPERNASKSRTTPSKRKTKSKSILDMVREREMERKEKERQQAEMFRKLNAPEDGDSKMAGSEDEEESEESDEDIEAMMDWRARRV